jgi:hypothetical protein
MEYKFFTLDEARELIPTLRRLLEEADSELSVLAEAVSNAAENYREAEANLDSSGESNDTEHLRAKRKSFEHAIEELSNAQQSYITSFNNWVEKITSRGVILRDLREGLLDFPAQERGFEYLLCWRKDESDIEFWHQERDGFVGRKPLAALLEYC